MRRLERQVDREPVEQCMDPGDLDATVPIGVKPTELLQRIEGIAAEFPDAVVDLLRIAAMSGFVAGGEVKAAHTLASVWRSASIGTTSSSNTATAASGRPSASRERRAGVPASIRRRAFSTSVSTAKTRS